MLSTSHLIRSRQAKAAMWKRLSSGVATLRKLLPLLGALACCYMYASHGHIEASHRELAAECADGDCSQDANLTCAHDGLLYCSNHFPEGNGLSPPADSSSVSYFGFQTS